MSEIDTEESFKEISKKYTKAELVKKTLASFNQVGEILRLVNIAIPEKTGLSSIQLTLLETSKSKQIKQEAIDQLRYLIKLYNKSIEEAKNGEKEAEPKS